MKSDGVLARKSHWKGIQQRHRFILFFFLLQQHLERILSQILAGSVSTIIIISSIIFMFRLFGRSCSWMERGTIVLLHDFTSSRSRSLRVGLLLDIGMCNDSVHMTAKFLPSNVEVSLP